MRQEWLNIWMDLAEYARGHSTISVVSIFHQRGNRGGGEGVFLSIMATTKETRFRNGGIPDTTGLIKTVVTYQ